MTLPQFVAILKERMTKWGPLDVASVLFVDDASLDYDPPHRIVTRRPQLFALGDEARWNEYLQGSHSWLHANLLTTQDGQHVVSLRHGPATGRAERVGMVPFSVNVSVEATPLTIEG